MLARAARRKLRRDTFATTSRIAEQLTLPWLCPVLMRRPAHTNPTSANTQDNRRRRRPSLSSRNDSRTLATAVEFQPTPAHSLPFGEVFEALQSHSRSHDLTGLRPWNGQPLIVHDPPFVVPTSRTMKGVTADPVELHQNLYACLRVGRLDRATLMLNRLAKMFAPTVPELIDAHNIFLQAVLEKALQEPKVNSMATIEDWYEMNMVQRSIPPSAQTFVVLLRAAMNFLEGDAQEDAICRFIAMAEECGPDVLEDVNASPDFADEEWDLLIRLQPETYEEPPSVQEVQQLQSDTLDAHRSCVEHGLNLDTGREIKPVPQKGVGLESLKSALSIFNDSNPVPYPHQMDGTKEEKDKAYNYSRQLKIEEVALEAATRRWRQEDEALQAIGIHGVLKAKPIQALMHQWYIALVPLFKERIAQIKKAMTNPAKADFLEDVDVYGPWLERCKPEKLAAITVSQVLSGCVKNKTDDGSILKVSSMSSSIGTIIKDTLKADIKLRHEAFLKSQRKRIRSEFVTRFSNSDAVVTSKPAPAPPTTEDYDKTDMPLAVRIKLGALAIELLIKSAMITLTAEDPKTGRKVTSTQAAFSHQMGFHAGKNTGWISAHHEILSKLRNESVVSVASVRLPMVFEPKPWTGFEHGGYYTTPQQVMRQKRGDPAQRVYAQYAIENGDMSQVLAGLDVLGRVPWQINGPVFEVMAKAWNSGEGIAKLVPEKTDHLERPEEPPADATYQVRAKWSTKLREYENARDGLHSQRCFQNFQIETAKAFLNEQRIFFPHSVDFRGRAYPMPPILNHIGSDLARGLLRFANGKELGAIGLRWLKIHLANLYGYDKASLREREQFAVDNMKEIYDSATNPLDGNRWWAQAEDPWQCLACCIELKNVFESPDPERYICQLPVHQDGTCNGLQHYAALGGDEIGARQVNLEPSDRPQDIYSGVAELVQEQVAKDAKQGIPAAMYVNGHITRKVVKRTVMTNVYGVTFMGAKQQVLSELKIIFPNFKETAHLRSLGYVALYVAHRIFEALGKIFNGAQEIQYWLGECGDRILTSIAAEEVRRIQDRYEGKPVQFDSKFLSKQQLRPAEVKKLNKKMESFKSSIIWTTPLKMPVVQPYRKDGSTKVKTPLQEIMLAKKNSTEVIDRRKQLQAFPPNFIHSLDATHMLLSALKCDEQGLDFAAVHDSFWTHPSDIPKLNVILRDAFVRMHSDDIVGRLAAEFQARYAGAMFRANLHPTSDIAQRIQEWRLKWRKAHKGPSVRSSYTTFDELALESKRQELLKSNDPKQVKEGEKMITPTSLWLANPDPKAFSSPRMNLLGDSNAKKSTIQQDTRDKILDAEAEAVQEAMAPFTNSRLDAEPKAKAKRISEAPLGTAELDPEIEEDETVDSSPSTIHPVQVWLPLTFPPVPKKGSWDVSRLHDSEYFFS